MGSVPLLAFLLVPCCLCHSVVTPPNARWQRAVLLCSFEVYSPELAFVSCIYVDKATEQIKHLLCELQLLNDEQK